MSISISVEAAKRIIKNLEEEGSAEGGLRLGVKGGGCAGLSYVMRYDSETVSYTHLTLPTKA